MCKIKREIEIQLSYKEALQVLRKWCQTAPEIVSIVLKNPLGVCSFPKQCQDFSCETLSCEADFLSNGRPSKMS
jgi:hypothetical protein